MRGNADEWKGFDSTSIHFHSLQFTSIARSLSR
jgi:hypothetical protein